MAYPQGPNSEGGPQTSGSKSPSQTNPDATDGVDDVPSPYSNSRPGKPGAMEGMGAMGSVGPQGVGTVTVMTGCPVCGYAVAEAAYGAHVTGHGNMQGHPGAQKYGQITPDDPSKPF